MTSEANVIVRAAIEKSIAAGADIGVQVCAYLNGQPVIDAWAGSDGKGGQLHGETLFNVFSVSKALTATALHIQAERGLVDYDAPIAEYWPAFAANGKAAATVRHAVTHRSGVAQMPEGTTPELICDWDRVCAEIAGLPPMFPVGGRPAYQSLTFGWIVGEIVRRTDPQSRSFADFVREEIAAPLNAPDLWLGLPPSQDSRVAKLTDANAADPSPPDGSPFLLSLPKVVGLNPTVFERTDVRRACIPAVGGIFTARSEARLWAMLAGGGVLDGVRLLSEERVRSFAHPRPGGDEADAIMGAPVPIGQGGYWLGEPHLRVFSVRNPRALCHPGAGGSIGWADPESGLAVAICKNRMFNGRSLETDPVLPIADAVREALGLA